MDEYTLIEAQLGVNWVGEWVSGWWRCFWDLCILGLDNLVMYKKIEWCFSYYHSTFSGSASRYQIIILFLKINFDTIFFWNFNKILFKLKKYLTTAWNCIKSTCNNIHTKNLTDYLITTSWILWNFSMSK